MGNGADNMSDFYRSYNAAYDGNTAENFLFKRTGYTSVSGNTWEIKDQFLNLTGGCDGGFRLPVRLPVSVQNAAAGISALTSARQAMRTAQMHRYGTV